jgi:hypothetical protein
MPRDQARIARGKQQHIRIHTAGLTEENWTFGIWGSAGSSYNVVFESPEIGGCISCTCMDFKLRGKTCKHIYHIISKVAQYDDNSENETDRDMINSVSDGCLLDIQYEHLTNRLKTRLQDRLDGTSEPDQGNKGRESCTECVICFDIFENSNVHICYSCGNKFHQDCANEWKRRSYNPVCPLCRADWTQDSLSSDVLDQFTRLSIQE